MGQFEKIEVKEFENYRDLTFETSPKTYFAVLLFEDQGVLVDELIAFGQRLLDSGLAWFGSSGDMATEIDTEMDLLVTDPKNSKKASGVETACFLAESPREALSKAMSKSGISEKYADDCKTLYILLRKNNPLVKDMKKWVAEGS